MRVEKCVGSGEPPGGLVAAVQDFSLYEYTLEIAASSGVENLGELLHVSRRDFDERETFAFRAQVPCLEYLSLLIENALLLRTDRSAMVYAGFEKLSNMEAVVDRYLRIADVSERVYAFGEADWDPPRHPHVRLFAVAPGARLAREWFVVADAPTMRVALVGIDENAPGVCTPEARYFRAIKTSDPALVAKISAALEELLDASVAA